MTHFKTIESSVVNDTHVGWTIEAAFGDGTYRLRSPQGHTVRLAFFRSATESELADENAFLELENIRLKLRIAAAEKSGGNLSP